MQNQKVIEELGFSPNEAKVYLASLALGEAHISDIAEKVKMPRSTVQVIVERLHEVGLMNFYVMRRYKYWVAEDPTQLLQKLHERTELVEEAIPRLVALRQTARKQKQSAAQQSKVLGPLQEVAGGMLQPVLICNSDTEILYVNEAWEDQFGYTSAEVHGKETRTLRSGKTPKAEYERLWKNLRAGKLFRSDNIVDKKKDGTLFSLFTIIFAMTYGNRTFYVQILEETDTLAHKADKLKEKFVNATKK